MQNFMQFFDSGSSAEEADATKEEIPYTGQVSRACCPNSIAKIELEAKTV